MSNKTLIKYRDKPLLHRAMARESTGLFHLRGGENYCQKHVMMFNTPTTNAIKRAANAEHE